MKISELPIEGHMCEITLVVISATPRETKKNKTYLAVEFFDGMDSIVGNYWDWNGANMPPKNAIVNVKAQVGEWQGKKQLTIKGMSLNTERHISEFMPSSGIDVGEAYGEAYAFMADIKDDTLRTLALHVLEELQDDWLIVPGGKTIHHAYVAGTLIHSLSVAKLANAMAINISGANVELCKVGGMLHDIGKLRTYALNGLVVDMTDEGMLYDHIIMGVEMIDALLTMGVVDIQEEYVYEKVQLLKHIILSHHGALEHGSVVTPMCIEAYVVFHADAMDATAEQIRVQSRKKPNDKWTDRIYVLNNRPHLTTGYTREVLVGINPPF